MVEHLDDLLAVDHLLDHALGLADVLLLRHEVARGLAADPARERHRHHGAADDHQPHPQRIVQHDAQYRGHRHQRHQQLRKALADHLAHGVHVVCVVAHDVAALAAVEVADGQALHVLEHGHAELVQRALGVQRLQLVVHGGDDEPAGVERGQDAHVAQHHGPHGRPVPAVVPGLLDDGHHPLLEDGRQRADDRAHQDQRDDDGQQRGVEPEQHLHQPREGGGALRLSVDHASASSPAMSSWPWRFWDR